MANKLEELYGFYDELVKAEKEGKLSEKASLYEKIISRALTGDSQVSFPLIFIETITETRKRSLF